jgi:putative endonuclease
MFFLYILWSESAGRFYIGATKNIPERLAHHNAGGTPSTKPYRPWTLVYSEALDTLHKARQREKKIKSWKNPTYMVKTLGINNQQVSKR